MSISFVELVTLTQINCGECGATYAINERYRQQKQDRAGSWHCPYCQCSWGYVETEETRLRNKLAAAEMEVQRAKQQTATANTMREAAEQRVAKEARKAKRAENGVCTCCNRSFSNLRRHMSTAHGIKNGEPAKPHIKRAK